MQLIQTGGGCWPIIFILLHPKAAMYLLAIEDILIQLRDAKTASEERRRLNSEAVRMTFFMVPSIYLITLIMALTYLDVPISRYIKNQLGTSEGVLMFYFILFLFVVNIALLQLVTNRRFDY